MFACLLACSTDWFVGFCLHTLASQSYIYAQHSLFAYGLRQWTCSTCILATCIDSREGSHHLAKTANSWFDLPDGSMRSGPTWLGWVGCLLWPVVNRFDVWPKWSGLSKQKCTPGHYADQTKQWNINLPQCSLHSKCWLWLFYSRHVSIADRLECMCVCPEEIGYRLASWPVVGRAVGHALTHSLTHLVLFVFSSCCCPQWLGRFGWRQ